MESKTVQSAGVTAGQGMFWDGFRANLPVAFSVCVYGSVLGVLAAQKDLSWLTLLIMNISVFAGSAQFVMIDMWTLPLPVLEITLAVMIINLRYILIGASLQPLFAQKPLWQKCLAMYIVADENWAVTMAALRKGSASVGFLVGGGFCLMTSWCIGTLSGFQLGAIIENPELLALDFAFTAVFTSLAVSLWQGKKDIFPWIIAAVVAVITESYIPGKWFILTGGLSGAFTAAFMKTDQQ